MQMDALREERTSQRCELRGLEFWGRVNSNTHSKSKLRKVSEQAKRLNLGKQWNIIL